jgi:hypothetical protein
MSKALTADQFSGLQDEFGDDEVRTYSGRGMMGSYCLGYVGEDMGRFIVYLAQLVDADNWDDGDQPLLDEIASAVSDLWRSMSSDSMGLDTIYYWRGIKVEEAA